MSARSMLVKSLPCLACQKEGVRQPLPTEAHHCNAGGHAGQKRLGNDVVVPLCAWHHRSAIPPGMTATDAAIKYGPSLARQSRQFRAQYGEDEVLLARTNELLEALA